MLKPCLTTWRRADSLSTVLSHISQLDGNVECKILKAMHAIQHIYQ
jgi:hypothetical protein